MINKLNPKVKDSYDITDTVTKFLSILSLSRAMKDGGFIVARDIRFKCAIFLVFWSLFAASADTARFFWSYWKNDWNPSAYSELVHSVILSIQIILVILKAATESEDLIKKFYKNIDTLDEELEIKSNDNYALEKCTVNKRFFALSIGYAVNTILQFVCWSASYGFKSIVPFTNDYVGNYIQQNVQFHYFIKLCMFHLRLDALNGRIMDDMQFYGKLKDDQKNNDWIKQLIRKYKLCYLTLYDQCSVINKVNGLQVMTSIVCVLISVIRTIYAMLLYAYEDARGYVFIACLMRTIPDLVLLTALVVYISKIVGVRDKILDVLERTIGKSKLSENEEACVIRFIQQIHRQPLVFTAHNFYVLDYTLLCGLLNSTVTYIIILTQIKAPRTANTGTG